MKAIYNIVIVLVLVSSTSLGQALKNSQQRLTSDPWVTSQLIEARELALMIQNHKVSRPIIFNIGVVDNIKGARNMGAASEKENLERFKKALKALPKTSLVVVYCGCCPMERCPNVRPAFQALQSAGFTNARLLNLPTNIKVDWINKGYPMEESI